MKASATIQERDRNLELLRQRAIWEMLKQKSAGMDEHGNLVRGFVTKIRCRCGAERWDDGTPCRNVVGGTSLMPIYCGRYPEKVKDSEDYTREG